MNYKKTGTQKIIDECRNETNTYLCDECKANSVCPIKNDIIGASKCEDKQYDLMYGTD